jgi:hypothetical protein
MFHGVRSSGADGGRGSRDYNTSIVYFVAEINIRRPVTESARIQNKEINDEEAESELFKFEHKFPKLSTQL